MQDHEIIFDEADGVYEFDGDPMLLVGETRPVGRVLARARRGKHGIAQFLSSDAMFTRYEKGLVWVMDRKAKSRSVNPQRIQVLGFEGQPSGSSEVEAGPDGRRPFVDPFIEQGPLTGTIQKNVTFMGPEERTLQNPYGITLRGSSFGIDGDLRDNFFFPEDHYHISDHRGPATGLPAPNDRRSTRWYDINQAGAPSVDRKDARGKLVERGYNQKSDRIIVVHRDAGGCAGGDPNDMNLALNFSGRTGFAFGLAEFRARPPVPRPPEPPKDPRATSSRKPGEDNEDTYATARASAVLATIAYERGGPFTPGHPKADKHRYAINLDGIPYNPVHIHINAKFTNESIVFDGRRNVIPTFEPKVGRGLIPVRCWEMFNPILADPYFCKDEIGGWDFHTRINSIPVWPTTPPPTTPPPETPPPITPTPPTVPPETPPGQPPGSPGTPITPEPDPKLPPTSPITKTPPAIVRKDGEKDGERRSPITPTPATAKAASDWGPAETVRPSQEVQPRPGNTEEPSVGSGNTPMPNGQRENVESSVDTESPVEKFLRDQQQRDRVGMTAMDMATLHITGVPFSDHMLSPKTLHVVGFYKHKYSSPRTNQRRALRRNPPDYTVRPAYVEGFDMSEPDTMRFGSSPGLTMNAPIELESWDMRHDAQLAASLTLSPQTVGFYPGVKLAFGFAGTFWDKIANGFEIFQGVHPVGGAPNQGLVIDGVDADGLHDATKAVDIRIPTYVESIQVAPKVPLTDLTKISAQPTWFQISLPVSLWTGEPGSSAAVSIGTLPAGAVWHQTKTKLDETYDTAIPSVTLAEIKVGTAAVADAFQKPFDVGQIPAGDVFRDTTVNANTNHASTTGIEATLTVVGAALADLADGDATLFMLLSKVV